MNIHQNQFRDRRHLSSQSSASFSLSSQSLNSINYSQNHLENNHHPQHQQSPQLDMDHYDNDLSVVQNEEDQGEIQVEVDDEFVENGFDFDQNHRDNGESDGENDDYDEDGEDAHHLSNQVENDARYDGQHHRFNHDQYRAAAANGDENDAVDEIDGDGHQHQIEQSINALISMGFDRGQVRNKFLATHSINMLLFHSSLFELLSFFLSAMYRCCWRCKCRISTSNSRRSACSC
jgi:hypothetical protein